MCKTNPCEAGLTPSDLLASFHLGPPWRHFAATSFQHLHLFLPLRTLGKHLWGEPWIPAPYPPNTFLFSLLQVLPPPEAQPEPSSPGNPPQPLLTIIPLPAVGGGEGLGEEWSLQPNSRCHITTSLRKSCSLQFDDLSPLPQKPKPGLGMGSEHFQGGGESVHAGR